MMGVFENCQIVFDLDAVKVSYKVRQGLKTKIAHHGGAVAYSLNKKTTHMIVDEGKRGGFSLKCSKARKLNIPIIGISYVEDCVTASRLLNPTPYLIVDTQAQSGFGQGKIVGFRQIKDKDSVLRKKVYHLDLHTVKVYPWNSPNAPPFPAEGDYQVARNLLLDGIKDEKTGKRLFYHLELHAVKKQIGERSDEEPDKAFMYRVFSHSGDVADLKDEESGARECRYLKTSRAAVDVYRQLYEQRIKPPWKMKRCKKIISRWIGSPTFRKDSFEASCIAGGQLASDVVSLVEQIWLEAVGHLNDILACPMERVTRQQVEKAETLLLQIREGLDKKTSQAELSSLSKEYYSQIPHKKQLGLKNKQDITIEQGICQLISDVQSVSEATDWSVRGSTEAKYRTLRCHIEQLCSDSAEHQQVLRQIQDGLTGNQALKVKKIFAVGRFVENSNFAHHLGNKKLLYHSSKPSNFLGICSRGLLMPKIVVEDLGGERTDAGMLGHGIYFADSASTSARYSAQSTLSQTRFMMICEVSLGRCHDVNHYEPDLNQPPSGYDSVKGVGAVAGQIASDFSANEYTIYNVNQQRLRYLVEFSMPEDHCDRPSSLLTPVPMETEDANAAASEQQPAPPPVKMKDVMAVPNPNDKVVPGLQTSGNKPIPLTDVFVRAKMMDLAAQVVIFQTYDNMNNESIEAKYVFPLEDSAAVCGFEAFIGDKHIIGTVKEKAQAHMEYKEAISKGHGAYLMDEEAPDVFTVSVGNLPPGVTAIIKITYVIELSVEGDKIAFNLPGSVASWRKEAAMSQELQKDVATMKIKDQSSIVFSLHMSLEMAADITSIQSITHPLKIKQTATKAVIQLPEDCTTLGEGFQLLVGVADIHRPRMWVEQHPENKDSQACMVTFYPDFESSNVEKPEIILLLDCSNSMKEVPLQQAKQIIFLALHHMTKDCIFNIVTFGTGFEELFPNSQAKTEATMEAAVLFVNAACATQGNTDVWRPLESYFLLQSEGLQNLFLVSDGHINNEESTLHAIAQNTHSRIFTFGVSSSANRHLLKGMARVGCGAFEFFDSNAKSRWESKVKAQLNKAKQPSVSSLAVEWKQHDDNHPTPVQAPRQLTSLFSGSRLVVYGFVQYCTEACLKASIDGEEVSTMVSTPELCITNGQMLHRLTARAVIRDWEDGTLDPDKTHHEARKNEQKSYIIDLSKKYSIVTQLTSFVAIEKREEGEDFNRDLEASRSVQKFFEVDDVDFLSDMDWQRTVRLDTEKEVDPMKKVEGLLEQANIESTFSILKAEEYYRQALDLAKTHLPDSTEAYLKIAATLHTFLIDSKRDTQMADKLKLEVIQVSGYDVGNAEAGAMLEEVLRGLHGRDLTQIETLLCGAFLRKRLLSGEDLKRDGVSLKKLAEVKDADFLSYMDWQKTVQLGTEDVVDPMKKVEGLLEQANIESTFSILKAEEYYRQALDLAKTHLPDSTEAYLKIAATLHTFLIDSKRDTRMADKLKLEVIRVSGYDVGNAEAGAMLKEVLTGLHGRDLTQVETLLCRAFLRNLLLSDLSSKPESTQPLYDEPTGSMAYEYECWSAPDPTRIYNLSAEEPDEALECLMAITPECTWKEVETTAVESAPRSALMGESKMEEEEGTSFSRKSQSTMRSSSESVPELDYRYGTRTARKKTSRAEKTQTVQELFSKVMTPDSDQPLYDEPTGSMAYGSAPDPVDGIRKSKMKKKKEIMSVEMEEEEGTSFSRRSQSMMRSSSESVPEVEYRYGCALKTTSRAKRIKSLQELDDRADSLMEGRSQWASEIEPRSALMRKSEVMRRKKGSEPPLQDTVEAMSSRRERRDRNREMAQMRSEFALHANKKDLSVQEQEQKKEKEEDTIVRDALTTRRKMLAAAADEDDEKDDEEEGKSSSWSSVKGGTRSSPSSSSSVDSEYEEQEQSMSSTGRESRSPSRSRSRSKLATSSSLSCEVTVEGLTSRVYRRKHELKMWQRALFKGYIPDTFPGWTSRELSVLKQAVNASMVTLEPFHVPIIVESLPDKSTLESLIVLDLFPCEEEDFISMTSSDEEDTSSDEEYEPESSVFFSLGKYVNFVKLFGLLKNAGIYSLGSKTAAQLLRVLLVALAVSGSKRYSSSKSTQHLNLNQLTHYIRQLEIARTDSWLEVASQMIA